MTAAAQSWAIIGGGMLGMTLAHRLAQSGQHVTLFESAPLPLPAEAFFGSLHISGFAALS